MHIPDGFLSNRIALSLDVLSGATIVLAARRVNLQASARLIPLMGVLGAFSFAAQLLNFPVLGGTSGHLVGGALLAILLGPTAAFLTMVTVILAQALFLQDGGLVALGANIFNIAAVTTFSGYLVFSVFGGADTNSGNRISAAAFVAGWLSLMLSATACSLELVLSGVIPLRVGLPAMLGYHAVIGVIEGGLTAGVLAFLTRVRPDLIRDRAQARLRIGDWLGAVGLVGIPFLVLSFMGTSRLPDPLQKLLAINPLASASAGDSQILISRERYLDYLVRCAVFILLIAIAYITSRLTQRRRGRP